MRIDKFLKVSRLIKRREVARELCVDQDILINQKPVKPMHEVNVGDNITLVLGKHILEVKVLEIREVANKDQAEKMFELISEKVIGKENENNGI